MVSPDKQMCLLFLERSYGTPQDSLSSTTCVAIGMKKRNQQWLPPIPSCQVLLLSPSLYPEPYSTQQDGQAGTQNST